MGVKRLNFINSIKELSDSTIDIQSMPNGSIKAVITTNNKKVTVSRNELVDAIERLVKKSLDNVVDDDIKPSFDKLKKNIEDSETYKVSGVAAKLRRFFANLFQKKRNSRLDKISLLVNEYSQKQKLKLEERELEERRALEEKRALLRTKAREELGFTEEEIAKLEESDQLLMVVEQQEKAYNREEVTEFLGSRDPAILRRLFFQNAVEPHSKFQIEGREFKLRGDVIYLKKESIGKGGSSNVYKIHQLCLKSFKISTVARKRLRKSLDEKRIKIWLPFMENESRMLNKIAELIVLKNRPDLEGAFQGKPHKVEFKNIKEIKAPCLEGPLYDNDLSHFLQECIEENREIKAEVLLPAFDLLIQGIAFLQICDILHLDIKLGNIFLERLDDGSFRCLLADFGGAYECSEILSKPVQERLLPHTPNYTPAGETPRQIAANAGFHHLSSFQLGCCLFSAFTDGDPYGKDEKTQAYLNLKDSNLDLLQESKIKKNIPEAAIQFILSLLDPDPVKRPIGQALIDAWNKAKSAMEEIPFR